ncbi:MAG TPA: type II secretion system protein GspM [Geminicoccaceae bacterium]|nr:type II secretion system protein GspM [Geminicoccaceae bacterium]
MLRRGSLPSRALALALLAALLLAGYVFVVAPVLAAYRDTRQAIQEAQDLLQRYRTLAGERTQLTEELAALEERAAQAGGYLEGSTDALAAVELQDRVRRIIERAGGQLQSTQILPASAVDATAPVRRAALRIQLEIAISGLQSVLYELEAGQPYLFVNELTVRQRRTRRRANTPEEEPALDVSFEVFGYVRAAQS